MQYFVCIINVLCTVGKLRSGHCSMKFMCDPRCWNASYHCTQVEVEPNANIHLFKLLHSDLHLNQLVMQCNMTVMHALKVVGLPNDVVMHTCLHEPFVHSIQVGVGRFGIERWSLSYWNLKYFHCGIVWEVFTRHHFGHSWTRDSHTIVVIMQCNHNCSAQMWIPQSMSNCVETKGILMPHDVIPFVISLKVCT